MQRTLLFLCPHNAAKSVLAAASARFRMVDVHSPRDTRPPG